MLNRYKYYFKDTGDKSFQRCSSLKRISSDVEVCFHRDGISKIPNRPVRKDLICNQKICGCRINPFIWISDDLKAIYFENPKTATTSIKIALDLRLDEKYYFSYLSSIDNTIFVSREESNIYKNFKRFVKEKINDLDIQRASQVGQFKPYYGSLDSLIKSYKGYYKFGFVRNPIGRFFSNWRMFNSVTFRKEKLENLIGSKYEKLTQHQFYEIICKYNNHHWLPQYYYFYYKDKLLIDDVYKYEFIDDAWDKIQKKLGGNLSDLPVRNTTRKKNDNNKINKNIIESVISYYKKDFLYFNYDLNI